MALTILEVEKLIAEEKESIKEATKIAEKTLPVLNELNRANITDPESLKKGLSKVDKKYQESLFNIISISVNKESGSFISLTSEKLLSLIDSLDEKNSKNLTAKGLENIESMDSSTREVLCTLTNDLLSRVMNEPSPDVQTSQTAQALSKKDNSNSRTN